MEGDPFGFAPLDLVVVLVFGQLLLSSELWRQPDARAVANGR